MHNTRRLGKEPLLYVFDLTQFEKENRRRSRSVSKDIEEIPEAQQDNAEWTLLEFAMPGLEWAR